MDHVTCEHCEAQLPAADAVIEPTTGRAWHFEHYGLPAAGASRGRRWWSKRSA